MRSEVVTPCPEQRRSLMVVGITGLVFLSIMAVSQCAMWADRVRRLERRLEAAEFRVQMHQETIDVCRGDLGIIPAAFHLGPLEVWEGGAW